MVIKANTVLFCYKNNGMKLLTVAQRIEATNVYLVSTMSVKSGRKNRARNNVQKEKCAVLKMMLKQFTRMVTETT